MRQRWFGATGRRVPQVALEGELELDDALVLEDVSDVRVLAEAHAEGRPVVVHARSAEDVVRALARPEVSVALVPRDRPELLELDLIELTYGEQG